LEVTIAAQTGSPGARPGLLTFPGSVDTATGSTFLAEPDHARSVIDGRTPHRGGTVPIPRFAVDRTEAALHEPAEPRRAGGRPAGCPVYADRPMAPAALQTCREAFAARSAEPRSEVPEQGPSALDPEPAPVRSLGPPSSAHADAGEITGRLRDAPPPRAAHPVHGEPVGAEAPRDRVDRELGRTAAVTRSGRWVPVR
jgi:Cft2 family RNA processing exonuclease